MQSIKKTGDNWQQEIGHKWVNDTVKHVVSTKKNPPEGHITKVNLVSAYLLESCSNLARQ